jgi:mono/diheme cytochrome c family protein
LKTIILMLFLFVPFGALAQDKNKPAAANTIDRGKYIVNHVAMCIQCHTPRDARGELRSTEYLLGAPITVNAPPFPDVKWAVNAPAIAGLNGYSTEQGIRLLMEGKTRDGRTPMPPMPPFRMNRADAEAVVAFLKSLK